LKFAYSNALAWAYEPALPFPESGIKEVLSKHKTFDYDSFRGYFFLWQHVSFKLSLPCPVLARILPATMSHWNAIKGGSDTITKLLWLNYYDPPSNAPQAHTIARMLLLGAVVIHRLNHIFTAKTNLSKAYPSLKHIRNAASKRFSFHDTLLGLVHAVRSQKFKPRPLQSVSLSCVNEGSITQVRTRVVDPTTKRGQLQTKVIDTTSSTVAWGSEPTGATPARKVSHWYNTEPTTLNGLEVSVHERMNTCTGILVSRVDPVTKELKGPGSRGYCAECHRLTNNFCINCRRWLCSPHLAANRENSKNPVRVDAPRFIKFKFEGNDHVKGEEICGIFSCWHKGHQKALEKDGAYQRGWRNFDDDDVSSMTSF